MGDLRIHPGLSVGRLHGSYQGSVYRGLTIFSRGAYLRIVQRDCQEISEIVYRSS